MSANRYIRARILAGLNPGQAARCLGIARADLRALEGGRWPCRGVTIERLAETYGCAVEWLTGQAPQFDYAALAQVPGSQDLEASCDRAAIAEILAAIPKR